MHVACQRAANKKLARRPAYLFCDLIAVIVAFEL